MEWALHDGMGSTAYMETATGTIASSYQYAPFGDFARHRQGRRAACPTVFPFWVEGLVCLYICSKP